MHTKLPIAALLAAVLATACAQQPARAPAPEAAIIPAALRQSITDPARSAIGLTDVVFDRPAAVAGRPAIVAEAVSNLEWLTVSLPADQRWTEMPGTVFTQLRAGRDEVRGALGIPLEASPNAVIGAMDATAAALRANNRAGALAALAQVTGPAGAEAALGVLNALPRLPRASAATTAAQNGMTTIDASSRGR